MSPRSITPRCASARLGLVLGVLDIMEIEVQDKRRSRSARDTVEVRNEEKGDKTRIKQRTLRHEMIMWIEQVLCRHVVQHLEPQCDVHKDESVNVQRCSVHIEC